MNNSDLVMYYTGLRMEETSHAEAVSLCLVLAEDAAQVVEVLPKLNEIDDQMRGFTELTVNKGFEF